MGHLPHATEGIVSPVHIRKKPRNWSPNPMWKIDDAYNVCLFKRVSAWYFNDDDPLK
jgi:hypothetical protein